MKKVQKENIEVEKYKKIVEEDEVDIVNKTEAAQEIQSECKKNLGAAEPELNEATKALKTLS